MNPKSSLLSQDKLGNVGFRDQSFCSENLRLPLAAGLFGIRVYRKRQMDGAFLEFPHERTEFSDANYAAIGRALAYATSFEGICRALSSRHYLRQQVLEKNISLRNEDEAFAAAVAEIWQQRLRRHLSRILEYEEFPSDIADTLKRAKSARNEIAHEITLGISHGVETDSGRADLLSALSELVHSIAEGYIVVELTSLIETHEELPARRFLSSYPTRIVEWVTQP